MHNKSVRKKLFVLMSLLVFQFFILTFVYQYDDDMITHVLVRFENGVFHHCDSNFIHVLTFFALRNPSLRKMTSHIRLAIVVSQPCLFLFSFIQRLAS